MVTVYALHQSGLYEVVMKFKSDESLIRLFRTLEGLVAIHDDEMRTHRIDADYGFAFKPGRVLERTTLKYCVG